MAETEYPIYIGDDLIGRAHGLEDDMPWRKGRFTPTDAFKKYRKLFEVALELSHRKDWSTRDALMDGIYALGLRITKPDGDSWHPCIGTNLKPNGFTFFQIRGDTVQWRPT